MSDMEELKQLRRLQELEAKADPSFMDKLAGMVPDAVKNIGTAAYKGVAGLAAGAADAFAGSADYTDVLGSMASGQPIRKLDPSMPVSRALEETGYQPKTQGEKYVNQGVRGALGAVAGPGGIVAPVRNAVVGGMAGLGGEAAGQLPGVSGTASEPYARVAGALLGGVGGSVATMPFRNVKDLSREMFTGTVPAEVEAAKRLMKQSSTAEVPINLDQAMGKDTNITNVVNSLVTRKEGQAVVDQLRAQPQQALALTNKLQRTIPGVVKEPAIVANETQAAASDALKAARRERTNATRPLFEQSGDLPEGAIDKMVKQVAKLAADNPDTNKGALFSQLAEVLDKAKGRAAPVASGVLDATGAPIMKAGKPLTVSELNDSLRSFATNLKSPHANSKAGDKEAIGAVQSLIGDLRDQMGATNPKFKAANELYSQISSERVDPLKKGIIGRVMGLQGEVADKEAVNKLLPILARGRDPKSKTSEILQFAEETKGTPEVFQDAVKTNFSNAVAKAEQQVNGQLSPNLAEALEKNLLGTAMQRQGLKDQLEAVAVHQGRPKDALYPGFMAALKIISASAKRPGAMGPDAATLQEIAGQSTVASGLKMIGLAPGKPAARGIEGALSGDAYRTLADNLTTPEGVAKLQALAKLPLMSVKAQNIVSTLLGTRAVSKPPGVQESNPGGYQSEAEQ